MNGEGISERKVEIRVRKNGRKDKVTVEKSAAEGLPKGWIKKLEITNRSGRKDRRDPFFIDPKSEYIFQSFKDASRYVETGKIGSYARKLKESNIEDDDSGNVKTVLDLEHMEKISEDPIEKQPMAKRVTRSQAKSSKNEEDEAFKRKTPVSPNAKSEEDTVKSRLRSASSQVPGKESVMKEEAVQQNSTEKRITRSEARVKKYEPSNSVPRRASKRLAGIELEPTPELKTRTNKAQRIVPPDDEPTPELKTRTKAQRIVPLVDGTAGNCKQLVNPVATSGLKKTDIISLNKEVAKSYNEHSSQKSNAAAAAPASESINRVSAEMAVGIETIGKPVGRSPYIDKKKIKTPVLISEVELNPVFHLDGYKQKEEMSPVSPLSNQTSATKCEKTTAGKRMRRSSPKAKLTSAKATDISPLGSSEKGKHPHPSDHGNAIQSRNHLGNELSKPSIVRGACSEMMEKSTNSFSSSYDTTLADLWKDPCIAFAIQTLTGESLHLPNTPAISSDPKNNHAKQKGVAFSPEKPGNVNTGSEKPGFSGVSPGVDIWKEDPCIDFAIKTLTGAIPIGLDEPDAKPKVTAPTQEAEGRQSNCDYLVHQQCNMKKNKTVGKSGDLRFTQSFSKN
ncbi:Methyl-CpG-binding domain-containing protein 13 [Cardamine amara subsp. amara]|uniref:Methyl-CpG-binding domain-containing protein 13 n=1 Tax=Cardamine amara subsp. amara TaxID=228776 RepID=A0ABD1A3J7_CARAN